jgi:hypothetical protein
MLVMAACTFPLLSTGTCVEIATESTIEGFFNAVTPLLVERVSEELGVTTSSTSGSTSQPRFTPSGGSS